MRAVLGARCCGSLLTAAELDVAVHTAHRELQASLRRARSRLLLRATTSTFDHFEFAGLVSTAKIFEARELVSSVAAPRAAAPPAAPHRPPTRAQRRRRRNRRSLHGVHSYYATMHTMNNARRAPRAHASLQPRRRCEPRRVWSHAVSVAVGVAVGGAVGGAAVRRFIEWRTAAAEPEATHSA